MSKHKVYCTVCNQVVSIELAGRPHDFMSWSITCPCATEEEVVIKSLPFNNMYGLFNICDLEPTPQLISDLCDKYRKGHIYI